MFAEYKATNPTIYTHKLEESIRKQIEKSHNFLGNVDTELKSWFDLISKLINLDHRSRLTAEKALEHPFFTEAPLPCENLDLLPVELKNADPTVDFHEFITKSEKNKKKDFKKTFTFKHNLPQDETPTLKPTISQLVKEQPLNQKN